MTPTAFEVFRKSVLDAAERLQAPLVRYVSRYLNGDLNAAEDVVQHAFMQLCRLATGSAPDQIDRWLYCVCRNRAIDVRRAAGRERVAYGSIEKLVDERIPDTMERLSREELYGLIRNRIGMLPEAQQEVIDLWANGLSYADISQIIERPESTVRVLVHRAITRLRQDKSLAAASSMSEQRAGAIPSTPR